MNEVLFFLPDLFVVSGLALLGVGLWLVTPIYFFLGIGGLLFVLGLFLSIGQRNPPNPETQNRKG